MSGPAYDAGQQPPRLLPVTRLSDVVDTEPVRVTTYDTLPMFGGTLTALVGAGESGKSWLAGHVVLDVASSGRHVLLIDGEMSAKEWRHRLGQLDAPEHDLNHVLYAEMSVDAQNVPVMRATVAHHAIGLIVWDSALSLIARVAKSENDNVEVGRLMDNLRAIVVGSAAGLLVDHVRKDGGSDISRGASAKYNALDVSLSVKLPDGVTPGPIDEWHTLLTVTKDRHGLFTDRGVRQISYLPRDQGKRVTIDISPVAGQPERRLLSIDPVMEALQRLRALDPPPTSGNDAHRRLKGTRTVALKAWKLFREENLGLFDD